MKAWFSQLSQAVMPGSLLPAYLNTVQFGGGEFLVSNTPECSRSHNYIKTTCDFFQEDGLEIGSLYLHLGLGKDLAWSQSQIAQRFSGTGCGSLGSPWLFRWCQGLLDTSGHSDNRPPGCWSRPAPSLLARETGHTSFSLKDDPACFPFPISLESVGAKAFTLLTQRCYHFL